MVSIPAFLESFSRHFGTTGDAPKVFFCPGRVNLIGEHIDYNGGPVLPTTISQGIYAAVRFNSSGVVQLRSDQKAETVSLSLADIPAFDRRSCIPARGWLNYPIGVLASLKQSGVAISGADVLFLGDLPIGAGVSSSAAMEVLTGFIFLSGPTGAPVDRTQLALRAQKVEREFVGVNCGIMDQFSVANGKKDQAILLDCATLKSRHVSFDLKGLSLVVMNTNKARELAGSKYNERRGECETALSQINQQRVKSGLPEYQDLCSASVADVEAVVQNPVIKNRALHVVAEAARVHRAVAALERGQIDEFGKLMNESHESLKSKYEVTGRELDSLVAAAQEHGACHGARMTGAGFGGCAIALVEAARLEDFYKVVGARYSKETGLTAEFFSGVPVDGVRVI